MSDTITYLVNMPGVEFNRYLNPADRMPPCYFTGRTPGMPDSREARLQNHEEYLGIDLTGIWTRIGLAQAYGVLLEHPLVSARSLKIEEKFRGEIREWECKLRELVPAAEIYRVATSLFREWVAAHDFPIYDHGDMHRFLDWLGAQEESELYSCRLPEAGNREQSSKTSKRPVKQAA